MAPDPSIPRSERLGLAIIAGVLLLATANNFVTFAIGSIGAAVALIVGALSIGLWWRARRRRSDHPAPIVSAGDVGTVAVCVAFLLAIAGRLFFWRSLAAAALFHPDLPWHVGRVAQQAFLSTPGYWPLSPLAFPSPLPFVSFVGDALVSATIRYLPFDIHAFTYSQVLFVWAIVLWTGAMLVAGGGPAGALITLTVSLLAVPAFIFGIHTIGPIVLVFFHANPNSLIAWPVGLALTFHLMHSFRRGTAPSTMFLLLVPPASVFLKVNQAFIFGFLQVLGFALAWSAGRRELLRLGAAAGAIWIAAIGLSFGMGPWPAGVGGIHPSIMNFEHYAHVALPMVSTPPELVLLWSSYVAVVAVACWGAALVDPRHARAGDVAIPAAVIVVALGYLTIGWVMVPPNGLAEGEPMHVNFELIMWLVTAFIVGAIERARVHTRFAVAAPLLAAGFAGVMVWMLNMPTGIPLGHDYDVGVEAETRARASAVIPGGSCFGYGRRFAIDVIGGNADAVIAATGCPVINGNRWRGYLGKNHPERVRLSPVIAVRSGDAFRLTAITSP